MRPQGLPVRRRIAYPSREGLGVLLMNGQLALLPGRLQRFEGGWQSLVLSGERLQLQDPGVELPTLPAFLQLRVVGLHGLLPERLPRRAFPLPRFPQRVVQPPQLLRGVRFERVALPPGDVVLLPGSLLHDVRRLHLVRGVRGGVDVQRLDEGVGEVGVVDGVLLLVEGTHDRGQGTDAAIVEYYAVLLLRGIDVAPYGIVVVVVTVVVRGRVLRVRNRR
mmetsp:Transcript_30117/g.72764  ORF Transcript_30117/g.72764 Transcript_30117/m.72764 type:complete len:220 (+) Transcript_30117:1522-2181(+)